MTARTVHRWAILHRTSAANIDGAREWLEGHPTTGTLLFATREAARAHCRNHYGYTAQRQDLRDAPHGRRRGRIAATITDTRPSGRTSATRRTGCCPLSWCGCG